MIIRANYDWQQRYEAAVLETDRSLLPKRIAEAQAAIDQRIAQLCSGHGSNNGGSNHGGSDPLAAKLADEEQAIADALAGIRILIKEIS